MYKAICANCGKDCEVPFRPTGDRPVYCSNCFKDMGGAGPRRPEGGDFRKQGFDKKRMFKAVCATCGKDCEVPFQPSVGKSVYCNDCFKKSDGARGKNSGQPGGQLDAINAKLDKILNLLSGSSSGGAAKKEKTAESKQELKKPAAKKTAAKKSKSKKKK